MINKISFPSTCGHTDREMELTEREKRRGLPSHAGGIRQEGTKACHTKKKLKRVYFPLARKREKTPPLHFYCFLLLIFPVHEYLFHPPERLKDEAPRSTRLLQEGRPPEGR